MKTAPCSVSTLSLHLGVPNFFPLLSLTCFHLCDVKGKSVTPGLHQRWEKRRKREGVFTFLVIFPGASWILFPQRAIGVSLWVDTGTLGTATFFLLLGKTHKEIFYLSGTTENPSSSNAFVFILKTHRRCCRKEGIRGHERQRCGIFLFCKDAISFQRVQGYASETVSCCALCCLFDASQLITLAVESYCFSASSSSKHNYSAMCNTMS